MAFFARELLSSSRSENAASIFVLASPIISSVTTLHAQLFWCGDRGKVDASTNSALCTAHVLTADPVLNCPVSSDAHSAATWAAVSARSTLVSSATLTMRSTWSARRSTFSTKPAIAAISSVRPVTERTITSFELCGGRVSIGRGIMDPPIFPKPPPGKYTRQAQASQSRRIARLWNFCVPYISFSVWHARHTGNPRHALGS